MSENRDEWVRVESEGELRPGMAVQLRPCACGSEETAVLLCCELRTPPDERGMFRWLGIGWCYHERHSRLGNSVRDGRLYRLRDLPAEETTTVATKRRVSVKAGR